MSHETKSWALILGGSSGMGLAAAKKLAADGFNLVIAHRDRKGAMAGIEEAFGQIRAHGVALHAFNVNALTDTGRAEVLDAMAPMMGKGNLKLVLHSIALGNLKLLAPLPEAIQDKKQREVASLARELGIDAELLQTKLDKLSKAGEPHWAPLVSDIGYSNERFLEEEDFMITLHSMAVSLVSWVQDVFRRGLFCADARVLGLTSEGNEVAWRGYAAVSAAKTALEAISRSIALEMAPHGLRCNILQPGVTDTPALRLIPGSDQLKASAITRNPFGRLTTPEDVADVVSLMVRDEARWINGAVIRVDGGEHIGG